MKKIDNWLSIQRFVTEVSQTAPMLPTSNVEVWGKVRESKHALRKARRFLSPTIKSI